MSEGMTRPPVNFYRLGWGDGMKVRVRDPNLFDNMMERADNGDDLDHERWIQGFIDARWRTRDIGQRDRPPLVMRKHQEYRRGPLLRFVPTATQRRCMSWGRDIGVMWGRPVLWPSPRMLHYWGFDDLYYDNNGRTGLLAGGFLSLSMHQISLFTRKQDLHRALMPFPCSSCGVPTTTCREPHRQDIRGRVVQCKRCIRLGMPSSLEEVPH